MLHKRFTEAFSRLLRARRRYDAAPREPDRVVDLASARIDLDDSRTEVHEARERYHPQAAQAPSDPPRTVAISDEEYQRLRLRGVIPDG